MRQGGRRTGQQLGTIPILIGLIDIATHNCKISDALATRMSVRIRHSSIPRGSTGPTEGNVVFDVALLVLHWLLRHAAQGAAPRDGIPLPCRGLADQQTETNVTSAVDLPRPAPLRFAADAWLPNSRGHSVGGFAAQL